MLSNSDHVLGVVSQTRVSGGKLDYQGTLNIGYFTLLSLDYLISCYFVVSIFIAVDKLKYPVYMKTAVLFQYIDNTNFILIFSLRRPRLLGLSNINLVQLCCIALTLRCSRSLFTTTALKLYCIRRTNTIPRNFGEI